MKPAFRSLAFSVFAFASAVLASGCSGAAPDDTGAADDAIVGGSKDKGDAAVVELFADSPDGVWTCTATLISKTALLTAAHCVVSDNDPKHVAPNTTFSIMTAASERSAGSRDHVSIRRANVHPHPKYDGDAAHDVAILVLDHPLGIAPAKIMRKPITSAMFGTSVRLVGYGITKNNGGGDGVRRSVATTLRGKDGDLVLIGNTGHQACDGDSGGPAFMSVDGVDTLIATDDLAATDRNCKDGDLYQRVDLHLDFIDSFLR